MPEASAPHAPPSACTPNTSRESSYPNAGFKNVHAAYEITDTPNPIAIAPIGATLPHAGVIATRPATAAVAPPSAVGFPRCNHSIAAHVTTAIDAAVLVFRKAIAASGLALSALPALNPNHPVHSRPAPIRQSGRLCGGIGSFPKPRRLPSMIAATSAEKPLDMWTTIPPAKSIAPDLKIQPSDPHTMCAIGQYTTSSQIVMKVTQTLNFMRSAIAPRIRAGVMIARIAWNMMKTDSGMFRGGRAKFAVTASMVTPERPAFERSPIQSLPVPKARL